jgi:hypothetical protein
MTITTDKNYNFIDILIANFVADNCTLEKKIKILEKQLSLIKKKVILEKQNENNNLELDDQQYINNSYWSMIKKEFTTTFKNK